MQPNVIIRSIFEQLVRYRFSLVCLLFCVCHFKNVSAQKPVTQFNGFGHLEYALMLEPEQNSSFSIGEHDFFVTSKLSNRISFLGEFVIRYNNNSPTKFVASIERSLIRFNYKGNHSLIGGKIHTPVNYWNDVYHHGRLFFPSIDRPLAFSYVVPLHTLGVQLQGQNLGKLNFGYDLVLGNSLNSTDNFSTNFTPSITAAVHIKPVDGMRIGLSYFYDYLKENKTGVHTGHNTSPTFQPENPYKGPLQFHFAAFSAAYFSQKIEFLNEFAYNGTNTDSLGLANNFSNYTYIGYRIKDKYVPYLLFDYFETAKNDLHTYRHNQIKMALGYRHEFNPFLNLKFQVEYDPARAHHHEDPSPTHSNGMFGFRIQLAYGF
jgi:hypothetical protein